MFEQGFEIVPGMHQVFVLRNENKCIVMVLAKVVDFLLAGSAASNEWFHDSISKKFKISRFINNEDLLFNRPHISRNRKEDIVCSFK